MEQRYKNFLLLLAALACFAVGAALFIGDNDMVYEQTDETQEEKDQNNEKGNTLENQEVNAAEEDEAAASAKVGSDGENFFVNYRMQRDKRRDNQTELYRDILNDATRDEEAKTAAQAALEKLYQVAAVEDKVEEILVGRNYSDVIFVMEDTVSLLIVKKQSLSEEEKTALASFVCSYAGIAQDSLSVFTVE
ncbi:MAG TPA: SpoIIIAH-like family protein [Clostridiales bacterium]|nr:SpoIIIAH-like family protein [Clostridiales bacterium]